MVNRRALLKLLGLLPFASLLRLAPARAATFPAYAVVPVTVRNGVMVPKQSTAERTLDAETPAP